MSEMGVIINWQNGLSFYGIIRQEAVIEAVLGCAHNLQVNSIILFTAPWTKDKDIKQENQMAHISKRVW